MFFSTVKQNNYIETASLISGLAKLSLHYYEAEQTGDYENQTG